LIRPNLSPQAATMSLTMAPRWTFEWRRIFQSVAFLSRGLPAVWTVMADDR
jgi:hypothetical protein